MNVGSRRREPRMRKAARIDDAKRKRTTNMRAKINQRRRELRVTNRRNEIATTNSHRRATRPASLLLPLPSPRAHDWTPPAACPPNADVGSGQIRFQATTRAPLRGNTGSGMHLTEPALRCRSRESCRNLGVPRQQARRTGGTPHYEALGGDTSKESLFRREDAMRGGGTKW